MGSRDLNTTAARVIADVLQDQWAPSRIVYGTDEPIGFDSPRDWAEYVAEVLVQALGLTEEHGWQLGDFTPHLYATKVLAQERIDELDALYGRGPGSKKWSSLPRQLVQRFVSPWVAASQVGEQP